MNSLLADFRLAVLLIARSRLWLIAASLAGLLASIAWLSAQFSPRQPATVALDVGLSFIRLVVPVLAVLHIQELLAREVDRRQILTSLTYPRSRAVFLVARYAAVVAVAAGLTLLLAMVLAGVVGLAGGGYKQSTPVALGLPYALTIGSAVLDFAVVAAFATALAAVATTPNLVLLGGIGFMIAARSASTIVQLLEREHDLVKGAQWYQQGLQWVQWILPDLAALDVRPVALYGKLEMLPQAPWALVLMALGYISVLLILACMRFERRQFA
ncbi:MAG TPA: ABC transporter permease subunit [Rhodocyclaceae bacterium]